MMNSKGLEWLIESYYRGEIDLHLLQGGLNSQLKIVERNQERDNNIAFERLIANCTVTARSPEEILIEKERATNIIKLLEKLKSYIKEDTWKMFILFIVERYTPSGEKYTLEKIGKQFGITKGAVKQRLQTAQKIAQKIITKKEYEDCFINE